MAAHRPESLNAMTEKTCGQGLAQHSVIPAKIAPLIAALSHNLELHMTALDIADENSKKEYDIYQDLALQYRQIASKLEAAARQMAGNRALPMGRHDMSVMLDPKVRTAFERYVHLERELRQVLDQRIAEDREILTQMQGA
jgi:hypothetical protein